MAKRETGAERELCTQERIETMRRRKPKRGRSIIWTLNMTK
jgi:hypothetical protein